MDTGVRKTTDVPAKSGSRVTGHSVSAETGMRFCHICAEVPSGRVFRAAALELRMAVYHNIGGAKMAKKVTGYIKLQIPAGKATPAPPVGPALGQHGVNIVEFTKQFNARTADKGDVIIPVVITVYADRSFSFITKTPPAAVLLKKACNLKSGSGVPNKTKVATLSKAKLQEIAELKMPDLNAASIEAAMSMIAGTARSMGITIEE